MNVSSVRVEVIPIFFTALSGCPPLAEHTAGAQSLPEDGGMTVGEAKSRSDALFAQIVQES